MRNFFAIAATILTVVSVEARAERVTDLEVTNSFRKILRCSIGAHTTSYIFFGTKESEDAKQVYVIEGAIGSDNNLAEPVKLNAAEIKKRQTKDIPFAYNNSQGTIKKNLVGTFLVSVEMVSPSGTIVYDNCDLGEN